MWWAWSGAMPFAKRPPSDGINCDVYGLAVCQYVNGEFYQFRCNRDWEVVGDMDHQTAAEAKAQISVDIEAAAVKWIPFEV